MNMSDSTGPLPHVSGSARGIATANAHHMDGDGLLAGLLRLAEALLAHGAGAIDALCAEVETLTRGGARLRPLPPHASKRAVGGRGNDQRLPHVSGPFRSCSAAACTAHSW